MTQLTVLTELLPNSRQKYKVRVVPSFKALVPPKSFLHDRICSILIVESFQFLLQIRQFDLHLNKSPSGKISESSEYCPVVVAVHEAGKLGEALLMIVD